MMLRTLEYPSPSVERGGITILVAFMLLVLLTVAAMGMSRNALREVVLSGTERQGVEVKNIADNGLNWSINWLDEQNRAGRSPDTAANSVISVYNTLSAPNLQGTTQAIAATAGSAMQSTVAGVTRKYDLQLTQMGSIEMPMTSRIPGVAVQDPVMWAMRANATLDYGGVVYRHSRESWVLAPPPGTTGH